MRKGINLLTMVIQTPGNATIWVFTLEMTRKVWKSQRWDQP